MLTIITDNAQPELQRISEVLSKYLIDGPKSKLGIYPKAAVATDAFPCADIARYCNNLLFLD